MALNRVVDQYKLEIEPPSSPNQTLFRAIATSSEPEDGIEAMLNRTQVWALLEHAYQGSDETIKARQESLESGEGLRLMNTNKDACIFTPPELVQFGFDPELFNF